MSFLLFKGSVKCQLADSHFYFVHKVLEEENQFHKSKKTSKWNLDNPFRWVYKKRMMFYIYFKIIYAKNSLKIKYKQNNVSFFLLRSFQIYIHNFLWPSLLVKFLRWFLTNDHNALNILLKHKIRTPNNLFKRTFCWMLGWLPQYKIVKLVLKGKENELQPFQLWSDTF